MRSGTERGRSAQLIAVLVAVICNIFNPCESTSCFEPNDIMIDGQYIPELL